MSGQEIEKLAKIIAKLPALGTRSSRRIVLYLLKKRETALLPLIEALQEVAANVKTCEVCGNYDTLSPLLRLLFGKTRRTYRLRGAGRRRFVGNGAGRLL